MYRFSKASFKSVTIDGVAPSTPAGDGWRLVLLGMAGMLAASLMLTPARVAIRKDDRAR